MGACQDPASPADLRMDQVAGEYSLVTIAGTAVPTGFAGTRMSQLRTLEGSLSLRIDGSYTISETIELRYQDSGNPFDPEPHFSTHTIPETGTFVIVADSLHFTQPAGRNPALWKARVTAAGVQSDNNGRTYAP